MNALQALRHVERLRECESACEIIHGADWDRTFGNVLGILYSGPHGKEGILEEAIRRGKLARSPGEVCTLLGVACRAIRAEGVE